MLNTNQITVLYSNRETHFYNTMTTNFINKIGILRGLLLSTVLVSIVFSFFSDGRVAYSGWEMVPTLLVPAITPIVFFVLAFDVMMSSILFADNVNEVRSRFKFILIVEISFLIILFSSWLPYFLSIGS